MKGAEVIGALLMNSVPSVGRDVMVMLSYCCPEVGSEMLVWMTMDWMKEESEEEAPDGFASVPVWIFDGLVPSGPIDIVIGASYGVSVVFGSMEKEMTRFVDVGEVSEFSTKRAELARVLPLPVPLCSKAKI